MISFDVIKSDFSTLIDQSQEIQDNETLYKTSEGFLFADSLPNPQAQPLDLHAFYEEFKNRTELDPDVKNSITVAVRLLAKQRYSGPLGFIRKTFDCMNNLFRGEGFHSDKYLANKVIEKIEVTQKPDKPKSPFDLILEQARDAFKEKYSLEFIDKLERFRGDPAKRFEFVRFFNKMLLLMEPSVILADKNTYSINPSKRSFTCGAWNFSLDKKINLIVDQRGNKVAFSGITVKPKKGVSEYDAPEYFHLKEDQIFLKMPELDEEEITSKIAE